MNKQVLVIEDDVPVRQALVAALRLYSYEVLEAADGQPGLELALVRRPALILCDIYLPGLSGIEVLREIRGHHETKTVPVMAAS